MTDSTPSGPSAVPPRKGQRGRNQGRPASGPARRPSGGAARREAVAAQPRRRNYLLSGGAIAVVVIVIVVLVIVKAGNGGIGGSSRASSHGNGTPPTQAVDASTYSGYTSVPISALAAAGNNYRDSAATISFPQTIDQAALSTGKPEVLFVGAEWCPFCAAERWSMVLALSKFGTFSNLHVTHSSTSDVDANTATWSFYGATYTSPYLTFDGYEMADPNHGTLQTLPASVNALWLKLTNGSYPFLDLNGKYASNTVSFSPTVLKGLTFQQIATAVASGTGSVAAAITASAGIMTSYLCQLTGGKPGSVCKAFPSAITH